MKKFEKLALTVVLAGIAGVILSGAAAADPFAVKSVTQLTTGVPVLGSTSWSPDGTKLAFNSCSYGPDESCIWTVNADGSDLAVIPNTIYSSIVSTNAWNPSGTKLIFQKTVTPGSSNKDIYTINIDGTELTQLTTNTWHEGTPAWSPDGTKIAYVVDQYWGGDYDIWIMNSDGSNNQQITSDIFHPDYYAWKPDGTKIAFHMSVAGQIWTINPDGSEPTQLTYGAGYKSWPTWSPDGKHIAFMSADSSGNQDIWVMDADGSNAAQLTFDSSTEIFPAWNPDGKHIAFASDRLGSMDIWVMELGLPDTTPPIVTITTPPNGASYIIGQTVLADYSATDSESGVDTLTGTVPIGSPIDTSTTGSKAFSATAKDKSGNSATETTNYNVIYGFCGIGQPINQDGTSVFNMGRTIPVKFCLTDSSGNYITNAVAKIYITKTSDKITGTEIEANSTSAATEGNLFRYDTAENQYIFNLNTKSIKTGTGTYRIRIELDDGTDYYVNIGLR